MLAARYGKHVLCEKPLAMTDEQGEQMSAAMGRAKKLLVVGFTYRFSTAAQRIKQMAANGDIGDIRAARLVYIWDCHGKFATRDPIETRLNMRRHGRMLEGGPAVDCGVHQIDLARWWLGSEVTRFTGHGAWVDEYEVPDHTWIHLDHANGAHSMIENSYSYSHTAKDQRSHYVFELIGNKGVIRYLRDNKTFELWTRREMVQLPWEGEKNFEAMYAQFAKAIESGDIGCFATAKDAIIATRIAREATEQAMRERLITKEPT
jgi:predicted dehydrogenase